MALLAYALNCVVLFMIVWLARKLPIHESKVIWGVFAVLQILVIITVMWVGGGNYSDIVFLDKIFQLMGWPVTIILSGIAGFIAAEKQFKLSYRWIVCSTITVTVSITQIVLMDYPKAISFPL